jgi:hypothetical protein
VITENSVPNGSVIPPAHPPYSQPNSARLGVGGAAFPTVTVKLTSRDSCTIQTELADTSYTDPCLTFTAVVNRIFDISAPTACFLNPSVCRPKTATPRRSAHSNGTPPAARVCW